MAVVDTSRFLRGLKRNITLPANQALMDDDDLLEMADDALERYIVPAIISMRQDYFVNKITVPCVDDQEAYTIPSRAIGRGLREIKLQVGDDTHNLRDLALGSIDHSERRLTTGEPTMFYFQGDLIILQPTANSGYTLHLWFNQQTSKLIPVSSAAKVTGFTATTVTLDAFPNTFVTGAVVDFIRNDSGARTLKIDASVTNAATPTLTFASDVIPSDLAVGDYVAIARQTPVVQIPDEFVPALETATAMQVLYSISDYEGYQEKKNQLAQDIQNAQKLMEPRIQGEPTKIVNYNGILRRPRNLSYRRFLP